MRFARISALLGLGGAAACFAEAEPSGDGGATSGTASEDGDGAATMHVGDGDGDGDGDDGVATGSADGGTATSSGPPTTGADETDDGSGSDVGSESSDGGVPTFCDDQPPDVVLCRDFDGESPLEGLYLQEESGTVTTTKNVFVSAPRALQATVEQDFNATSAATAGQTVLAAPLPFDGRLQARVWIDPACFVGSGERSILAVSFFQDVNLVNFTLWATATGATLYSSVEPEGFPSVAHPVDLVLPTGTWVDIALAVAADSPGVTLTVAGNEYGIDVQTWTSALADQIANVSPAIGIGTVMQPGQADCTMVYDDVVVTAQ